MRDGDEADDLDALLQNTDIDFMAAVVVSESRQAFASRTYGHDSVARYCEAVTIPLATQLPVDAQSAPTGQGHAKEGTDHHLAKKHLDRAVRPVFQVNDSEVQLINETHSEGWGEAEKERQIEEGWREVFFRAIQAVLLRPEGVKTDELYKMVPDALMAQGPRPKWGVLFKKVDDLVFQTCAVGRPSSRRGPDASRARALSRVRVRPTVPRAQVVNMQAPPCLSEMSVAMARVHLGYVRWQELPS